MRRTPGYAPRAEDRPKASDLHPSDDETTSDEDEDATLLTPKIEKKFRLVLGLLKKKDKAIYDPNNRFFGDEDAEEPDNQDNSNSNKKDAVKEEAPKNPNRISFDSGSEDEDGNDGDDFFKMKEKTKEQQEREDRDFEVWKKQELISGNVTPGKMGSVEPGSVEMLQQFWSADPADKKEAFLRDFILNERWMDKSLNKVPQMSSFFDQEDEESLQHQDQFEAKFNFRFEEEESGRLFSYHNSIKDSVRKVENKRGLKKKLKREREKNEKKTKEENMKRLKNEKKKEIVEKLKQIQKITGNSELPAFKKLDLEGDFDPLAFDRQMEELFNNDYYEGGDEDDEKPVFSDEDDEELYYGGSDAPKDKTKSKSKTPDELKEIKKYVDDYYKLDYEDMIDDIPCRYNYKSVNPQTYGLSIEEIVFGDEDQLKKIVPTSKVASYRDEKFQAKRPRRPLISPEVLQELEEELSKRNAKKGKKLSKRELKRQMKALKQSQSDEGHGKQDKRKGDDDDDGDDEDNDDGSLKKRKKESQKKKKKSDEEEIDDDSEKRSDDPKKKKKKKTAKTTKEEKDLQIDDDQERKVLKKRSRSERDDSQEAEEDEKGLDLPPPSKKPKKKKKSKESTSD